MPQEPLLCPLALLAAQPTVDHSDGGASEQLVGDVVVEEVERVTVLGEDHDLLSCGGLWRQI